MAELLLELLTEEIPARMQRRAIADLVRLVRDKLAAAEIPAESIQGYVTPRRLAIVADGIPLRQPDRVEERRGPRVGAPQAALDGFLRAAGLAAVEDCEVRDTGKGEFYFAIVRRTGGDAAAVLPGILRAAMAELPWPKSMRYPASTLRWVRPLSAVVALFAGAVVPLALDQVPVGRTTRGHRFLAPGEIAVAGAADYRDALRRAFVILDPDERRERIRAGLDRAASAAGVSVKSDPALLDEVTGLVEFPVVFAGAIDADSMALPPEVLSTAMRTHQKYFSCLAADGTPARHFLFVANTPGQEGGSAIVAGNERVLRARLADARFFWDQDRRVRLDSRVPGLAGRVYHAGLGSMRDKVRRMERLAEILAGSLGWTERLERVRTAVRLAKADLSTGMVGEFPELQGVMGRYYALNDGEDAVVAAAIGEHYKPQGPGDTCPTAPESIVVALADKIDTLAGFFAIGEKPTGSRDPFALRRAALGLIRLILENALALKLQPTLARAFEPLPRLTEDPLGDLLVFIVDRAKVHLRESGVRHDLVAAVFADGLEATGEDDLVQLVARARALQTFVGSEDGANLLAGYRRAANIVAIEERREAGRRYDGAVDRALLGEPEERALELSLGEVEERVASLVGSASCADAMAELARLRPAIDTFFEKVTVNSEEPALRENRLKLLSRIRATLNQVADFSRIEG